MTAKNLIKFVCSLLLLVALVAALAAIAAKGESLKNPTRISLEDSAAALEHGNKTERIAAVQALVARATAPQIACELGKPLLLGDCGVRLRVAHAFGTLTSTHQPLPDDCRCEPQILDYLSAAYARERDPVVKVAIVRSMSEFTTPAAAELLGRAQEDSNATVRIAAFYARTQRERRLGSFELSHP